MSDLTNVFTDIADAIRAKTETQITYKPTEMADAINNISSGGGAIEITTNNLVTSFNSPVIITDSVTNTSNMFTNCYNFNQPMIIPDSVTNTSNMFTNCYNFNQPMIIPDSVTTATAMFINCYNFNQPVTIGNNVNNVAYMFANCSNFNLPVTIGNNVTTASFMFANCSNFNLPVIIPDSVATATSMFDSCLSLNQYIVLGRNTEYLIGAIQNCTNFNQPVIVYPEILSVARLLNACTNFASDIIFLDGVVAHNKTGILRGTNGLLHKNVICSNASNYTQVTASTSLTGTAITWTQDGDNYYNTQYNITIMDNAVAEFNTQPNYAYYFESGANASEIKPAMMFGDTVNNIKGCFSDCSTFNSYVILGNNVQDMSYAFQSTRFNKPIVLPESISNVYSMLYDCAYFGSSIIFRNTANLTSENVAYMLRDTDDDKPKTIICDNALLFISSELFTRPVEWTEIANGVWFNATVNTTIKQI